MHGAQAPRSRDACLNLSLPRVQDNASPISSCGSVVDLPAPSVCAIYLAERGSSWEKTIFYACCIGQTGTVVAFSCLSPTRLSMSPKANLGSSLCTGWMDKDVVAFGSRPDRHCSNLSLQLVSSKSVPLCMETTYGSFCVHPGLAMCAFMVSRGVCIRCLIIWWLSTRRSPQRCILTVNGLSGA